MTRTGILAVNFWTAGRAPSLVTFGERHVGPSLLGLLVLERWAQMATVFPALTLDEFAVLPDRFRALVHSPSMAEVELAIAWFRAAVGQEARLAGLAAAGIVWEYGHDLHPVESPEELASWRRRIGTGRLLGLSGRLPEPAAGPPNDLPRRPGRTTP